MCGIAGKLSWRGKVELETVIRMRKKLDHRGPDSSGVYQNGPIAFAHRRLAVIDLDSSAEQPMLDKSGRYCIIFNGEIYNYLSLRRELEQAGVCFRTKSDTEVLLESYKYWGENFLTRINGMFAFAIWDQSARKLFMARDRLGEKPLFYYFFPHGGISFASEIKSLIEDNEIPLQIDYDSLNNYLSLSYVLAPRSIIHRIVKLPPAHSITIEEGKNPKVQKYWSLRDHYLNKRNFKHFSDASDEFRALFQDSISLRLQSDVPVGSFLSGGLDSSIVTAAMASDPTSHSNIGITADFSEKSYSELDDARSVAKHLRVPHSCLQVNRPSLEDLRKIIYFLDEPFADTSIIPMYYLSLHAKKHVTVMLSGDGADELFGGYSTYLADRLNLLFRFVPGFVPRIFKEAYCTLFPVSRSKVSMDMKIRRFLTGCNSVPCTAHYSWREIFSRKERQELLQPDCFLQSTEREALGIFESYWKDLEFAHPLDRAMYVDTMTWLPDDILTKVDRCTMAHGLEARTPFLDHRIAEFAASLPIEYKISGVTGKRILRESFGKALPRSTLRKQKSGFNAPILSWIKDWKLVIQDEVSSSTELASYFSRPAIERLIHAPHYAEDMSFKLFTLLNFVIWWRDVFHSARASE